MSRVPFEVRCGDAYEKIQGIQTVHCVVTSPPYFQKKKYDKASGTGDQSKEIGREETIKEFAQSLVDIFRAIPLHPAGSIWVNLGDTRDPKTGGCMMIPEHFAIRMKDAGFILADSVVWAKVEVDEEGNTEGGCMPEPAYGRLNGNGYEMLYHFVRGMVKDAWSDTCAVRIPRVRGEQNCVRYLPDKLMRTETCIDGRNLHNVWRIQMGQTKKKHYAVYPVTLCERPIAMTCPMWVCPECGEPRERITKMVEYNEGRGSKRLFGKYKTEADSETSGRMDTGKVYVPRKPVTTGWTKCDCGVGFEPGIVLDPFCGTGTTGEVALKLGRRFIGIDLYKEYADMTKERCQETLDWLSMEGLSPEKESR
jgi:DNA modification methylase